MSEFTETIDWTPLLEEYFSSSGEKAHCLCLLHKKSESMFSNRKNFIELPVIIGSGLIGFLNAGSSSMFPDARVSSVALGVGSLVVGILQTVNTYFGWARRCEAHKIASIQYGKLYRFLKVEMSLPRNQRMMPNELLKKVKDDYDRLSEISPLIPEEVINEFKKKFGDERYKDISKPEETNGLEKIVVYDNPVRSSLTIRSPQSISVDGESLSK